MRLCVPEPIIFLYLCTVCFCVRLCVCAVCILRACVTLSLCLFFLLLYIREVCDWQLRVWESSPSERLPGSVSGPGRGAGWAAGGERQGEVGHTAAASVHFGLKDSLYLAISGRWRVEGEWSPCPRWGDEQVSVVIMRKGELSLSPALPVQSFFLSFSH